MNALQSEIIDYVLRRLIDHSLTDGDQLPSEHDLAKQFNTTRINVRRAFERMVDMGYLYHKVGKGFVVKERHQPIELIVSGDQSFSLRMAHMGLRYQTKTIGCVSVPYKEVLWRDLEISSMDKVFKISRLRYINDEPIALHMSYVSSRHFRHIGAEGEQISSLINYYKDHGYEALSSRGSRISISFPTHEEMGLLHCHGLVPLLLVETDCICPDKDVVLDVSKIIYKTDRFKYML